MRSWFGFALLGATVALPAFSQSSDLSVSKSGSTTASPGSNIAYTVTILNNGPDSAPNATLTDSLPSGATFVSAAQNSGPAAACTTPSVGASGGTVACTIASLAPGSSAIFTITVNASAGSAGTILLNTATVSSGNPDDFDENNVVTWGTTISGGTLADIGVTKTGPATAAGGANVSYTITVANFGPNNASSVTWTDTLGAGLTFVSLNQTSGPSFTCPGNTTPCTIASLPNGSAASFTLVATVAAIAGDYTNMAFVTSANDPNPDNDAALALTSVATADVGITKTAPPTATAGSSLTYTITVSNNGPDPASTVSFTDTLPAGTTFASITQSTGPSASCSNPAAGSAGSVVCSIPTLLNGQSAQFSLTVNASSSLANGMIVSNTAVVSTSASDTNPSNNSSSASTIISVSADVTITKTGPNGATVGGRITYSITVSNNGPSNAASVSFTDALPAGTTFNSITQNSGSSFSCAGGATVVCSNGALASGASAGFTLIANVVSGSTGSTIVNTATVSSTTTDPNPANNASTTVPATLGVSADVTVTNTLPISFTPGATVAYTVVVSNAGPSTAASVSLTDSIPIGTTFVSMTQTAGPTFGCTNPAVGATGTSTCTIGSLASGASASFAFSVKINPGVATGTTISNTASISSTTPDSNAANNSATASGVVSGPVSIPTLDPFTGTLLAAMLLCIGSRLLAKSGPRTTP